MDRENTIGFVTFKMEGQQIKYLMLHHEGHYWNFPKGRQIAGEDNLTTAKRELAEETGITDIKIIDGFCHEYDYDFDTSIHDGVKEKVCKHAIFFLGQINDQQIRISDERIDFGWFDFQTALTRAFFQEGQDLLKKANEFLLKQQDFVL